MPVKLYGIPNCGTVKKSRIWLESHDIDYEFHDFKKHGVSEAMPARMFHKLTRALAGLLFRMEILFSRVYESLHLSFTKRSFSAG